MYYLFALSWTTKPCVMYRHFSYQSNLISFQLSSLLSLPHTHTFLPQDFATASTWNALYLNTYMQNSFPYFIQVSSNVHRG